MTKATETITVSSPLFAEHGYWPDAELKLERRTGRYVVTLYQLDDEHASEEIAWEPGEPDRQQRDFWWAAQHPIDAVLDAIRIAIARRA